MEEVTKHSIDRATDEAVRLWSFASTQYPIQNGTVIQAKLEYMVVESASAFSFNARRAMEILDNGQVFKLRQTRFKWKPAVDGEVVGNLWDALNRIIHSKKMIVGFEQIPEKMSVISGGAYVVPYLRAETDRWMSAFIDTFALSYCFLYEVLPALLTKKGKSNTIH